MNIFKTKELKRIEELERDISEYKTKLNHLENEIKLVKINAKSFNEAIRLCSEMSDDYCNSLNAIALKVEKIERSLDDDWK